jgi:NAD(P) transhydrogenase subunit beta
MALVLGANDVTNPAAKHNKISPLYGMPILEVERAKSIIVLKRSLLPGFAGVDKAGYLKFKLISTFGWPHPAVDEFRLLGRLDGG